jgi:hypothetical protein
MVRLDPGALRPFMSVPGSFPDLGGCNRDIRFTPMSRHRQRDRLRQKSSRNRWCSRRNLVVFRSFLTSDKRTHRAADLRFLLRLPSRLAFALTVRSAGFKAAATTAVAACGVFFPVRALDAIRIVSVCAAIAPDVAAATFSDTIRFNSALSLDVIPAAIKIGHRHHSVMLVSRTAAPRSAAK